MAKNAPVSLRTKTLLDIDKKLASIDTPRLVFLCRDLIAQNDLDKIQTGMHLFQALEKEKHIKRTDVELDISLLLEILHAVRRKDLSEELADKMNVSKFTQDSKRIISKFRYLLLDIAMTLSDCEMEDVTFMAAELLGLSKDKIKDIFHLLVLLERDGHISDQNVRCLHEDLITHQVLKKKIIDYQEATKEETSKDHRQTQTLQAEKDSSRAPSSSGQDINPGLLRYSVLAINKTLSEGDRRQAKCKREQLQHYYESSQDCPHKYAILNLIAVFHFRLGNFHEAEKALKEVVNKDPTNVHAWQDLALIFKRKFLQKEVSRCEERSKKEVAKIGRKGTQSDLVYARYLAGQALASAFDLHLDTNGTERLDNSISLYERALVMGDGVVDSSESSYWKYYVALDHIRSNNIRKVWEDENMYRATFDKIFRNLEPSLKSDNIHRQSSALGLLGNLFSQKPRSMSAIPEIIRRSNFRQYWGNPKACYHRALELNEENWIALNRLARLVFDEGREAEAMELVKKSLKINPGSTNHMARRVRGNIHRRKFNKLQRQGSNPDKALLDSALKDLKECIDANPYVLDMIHLAEVHHKLSWGESDKPHDENMLHEALHWCAEAESCQDGAMKPELHQRRALILQDLDDHEGAVKCFMQAMDCETQSSQNSKNFLYMYIGMLRRFKILENPKNLLLQLVYWLEEGTKKYTKHEWRTKSKKLKKKIPEGEEDQSSVSKDASPKSAIKLNYFINKCPEEMVHVLQALAASKKPYQLELAQNCIKTFKIKVTKVSCSLSPEALDKLEKEVAEELLQCSSVGSEKSLRLKVDTLKSATSSSVSSFKSAPSSLRTGKSSATRSTDRKSKSTSQCHVCGVSLECVACGSRNPDNTNTEDVFVDSKEEIASQSSGSHLSLSGIPPASPGNRPLDKLMDSDTTVPPPDAATSPGASANLDGTPSSAAHLTASSSAHFDFHCKLQFEAGFEKEFRTTFSINRDDFSIQKFFEELNRVLEQTDLRKDDIGDAPPKAQHTDYKYDFYTVYDDKSPSASDFTFYHLRPQLEEGQSQMKGCFDIRDFQAGRSKVKNMGDALVNSAKVLFLISENFFGNPTCEKMLSMALLPQCRDKLVPVLLDNVILPIELQDVHHIDARTTINWGLIRKHLEPPELEK